ncbi:hypothetical protein Catovirus_1_567 [Catovirus CTV1]|uniref:Uncharacterized protein n=1 Tax=Catovirus CTV1 TaxID=1977631 RepID=A0A1V0S9W7_9VIRU|nr:hypothetical protein Catovirus_1_567 [Catovirus CTV1]
MNHIFEKNSRLFTCKYYDESYQQFIEQHKDEIIKRAIKDTTFNVRYEKSNYILTPTTVIYPDDEKNNLESQLNRALSSGFNIMETNLKSEYINQITKEKLYVIPCQEISLGSDNKIVSVTTLCHNYKANFYVINYEKLCSYKFIEKYDINELFKSKCAIEFYTMWETKTYNTNMYMIGDDKIMDSHQIAYCNNWLYKNINNKADLFFENCLKKPEDLINFDNI